MIGARYANIQYFNPKKNPGLSLWLDGNDPMGNGIQPANNASVAEWVDKSGLGNNFIQSAGSSQPLFISNFYLNQGAILFNGTSDYMECPYADSMNTTDTAIFVVCACNDPMATWATPLAQRGFNLLSTYAFGFNFYKGDSSDPTVPNKWLAIVGDGTGPQNLIDGTMTVDQTTLLSLSSISGTITLLVNGSSIASNTYVGQQGNSTRVSRIGSINEATAFYFTGPIAEVIIYQNSLSEEQYLLVQNYLIQRWNI